MLFKDIITLVSVSSTKNSNGFPVVTETTCEAYADVQSVKRQEFYEAMRSGVSAAVTFKIFSGDYKKQKYVEHDGIRYKVVRAYTAGDWTELNCTEAKEYEH